MSPRTVQIALVTLAAAALFAACGGAGSSDGSVSGAETPTLLSAGGNGLGPLVNSDGTISGSAGGTHVDPPDSLCGNSANPFTSPLWLRVDAVVNAHGVSGSAYVQGNPLTVNTGVVHDPFAVGEPIGPNGPEAQTQIKISLEIDPSLLALDPTLASRVSVDVPTIQVAFLSEVEAAKAANRPAVALFRLANEVETTGINFQYPGSQIPGYQLAYFSDSIGATGLFDYAPSTEALNWMNRGTLMAQSCGLTVYLHETAEPTSPETTLILDSTPIYFRIRGQ